MINLLIIWVPCLIFILIAKKVGISAYILVVYPIVFSIILFLINIFNQFFSFIFSLIIGGSITLISLISIFSGDLSKKRKIPTNTKIINAFFCKMDFDAIYAVWFEPDNGVQDIGIEIDDLKKFFDFNSSHNFSINKIEVIRFDSIGFYLNVYMDTNDKKMSKINSIKIFIKDVLGENEINSIQNFMNKYNVCLYDMDNKTAYFDIKHIEDRIKSYFSKK